MHSESEDISSNYLIAYTNFTNRLSLKLPFLDFYNNFFLDWFFFYCVLLLILTLYCVLLCICACVLLLILILFFVLLLIAMFYNWRCMYVWYVQLNSIYSLTYLLHHWTTALGQTDTWPPVSQYISHHLSTPLTTDKWFIKLNCYSVQKTRIRHQVTWPDSLTTIKITRNTRIVHQNYIIIWSDDNTDLIRI